MVFTMVASEYRYNHCVVIKSWNLGFLYSFQVHSIITGFPKKGISSISNARIFMDKHHVIMYYWIRSPGVNARLGISGPRKVYKRLSG